MKKSIILCFLVVPSVFFAQVAGLENLEEVNKACAETIEEFRNMNYEKAFQILNEFSAINQEEFNALKDQALEQQDLIVGAYGKPLEVHFVKTTGIENVLKRYIYVIRHEKYGLKFEFDFYRGRADKWRLTNFSWNDKLKDFIEH